MPLGARHSSRQRNDHLPNSGPPASGEGGHAAFAFGWQRPPSAHRSKGKSSLALVWLRSARPLGGIPCDGCRRGANGRRAFTKIVNIIKENLVSTGPIPNKATYCNRIRNYISDHLHHQYYPITRIQISFHPCGQIQCFQRHNSCICGIS